MEMASEIPIDAMVEVLNVGRGIVRYNGQTEFKGGRWIGVELEEPNGKNNGTVLGFEYFKCRMLHGIFVRPNQVTIIETPTVNVSYHPHKRLYALNHVFRRLLQPLLHRVQE